MDREQGWDKDAGGEGLHSLGYSEKSETAPTSGQKQGKPQSRDTRRGSPALSVGVEKKALLYTISVVSQGDPLRSLKGLSSSPPPNPVPFADWSRAAGGGYLWP